MAAAPDALARAIDRLREGLHRHQREPHDEQLRDGLIQRFEFTYEIAHKTLKRTLEAGSATPQQYDHMAFADIIRSGSEQGLLLGDWRKWKGYRDMRAKTSHTDDESVAIEVVSGIADFLREAEYLRDRLQERQA